MTKTINEFDADRTGTGTKEWAEHNENIQKGCSANCLYCYAACNAHRFKLRPRADWGIEQLTKRADITSYPRRKGVVMFPSAHDVSPFNVIAYIRVAKLILGAGNQLLIVSKPNLECIAKLVTELADYKAQILFRFTIGTTSNTVAAFWEPGAPAPEERIAALKLAFQSGYRTSISAEPLLGGPETALAVMDAVRPYVTDSVWVGRLNRGRSRVDMSVPLYAEKVIALEDQQRDAEILRMCQALAGDPLVKWKDSIKEVLARANTEQQNRSVR